MDVSAAWPEWDNRPIVLYHGTLSVFAERICKEGVDVTAGRAEVDFGQGFYTTTSLHQANSWARSKALNDGRTPSVVRITLDRAELSKLRSLVFIRGDANSVDYWSFVQHCRRGNQIPPFTSEQYDVVYGPVAFRWGPEEFEIKPGLDQISFHGVRAQNLLRDSAFCKVEALK